MKQQKQLANQGQTVVTMDMLQKCLRVLQDSQGKIEQKTGCQHQTNQQNTDKITALTREAVYPMTEKRAAEDEQSGKQYDIVGIPKQATQEDKMNFVAYILGEIGLTKALVKSCDVQAMETTQQGKRSGDSPSKTTHPRKPSTNSSRPQGTGTWSFGEQMTRFGKDTESGEDGPKAK